MRKNIILLQQRYQKMQKDTKRCILDSSCYLDFILFWRFSDFFDVSQLRFIHFQHCSPHRGSGEHAGMLLAHHLYIPKLLGGTRVGGVPPFNVLAASRLARLWACRFSMRWRLPAFQCWRFPAVLDACGVAISHSLRQCKQQYRAV